ncbi:hypothetical protein ABW02_06930 [Niallia circulans]|uniref:NADH dehydrogenase subunit 4 n=1 Tax=Niallia circulans TaxID=1397 RepID=A0A0J1LEQ3_NIACI|nr:hypothetical protein ABW02_06930 [Niallia circulans]UQZ77730.1 hypothetical protein C2I17_21060 [Niallia circulans]
MMFIGPLLILFATFLVIAILYSLLFRWLPNKIFNFFLGPIILILGGYIWIYPMQMGFHELFK